MKTKLCLFYPTARGCKFGNQCNFGHSLQEIFDSCGYRYDCDYFLRTKPCFECHKEGITFEYIEYRNEADIPVPPYVVGKCRHCKAPIAVHLKRPPVQYWSDYEHLLYAT